MAVAEPGPAGGCRKETVGAEAKFSEKKVGLSKRKEYDQVTR